MNNAPRSASIIASEETYVATLTKDQYNEALAEIDKKKCYKQMDFFEKSIFGGKVPHEILFKTIQYFTLKVYK